MNFIIYLAHCLSLSLSLSLSLPHSLSHTHTKSISRSQSLSAISIAAVDCEMCDTADGLELSRLTVIDDNHTVILDTLVKPKLPITNYRTQWSGITEDSLKNVTVSFEDAQLAFLRIISSETYLIGESQLMFLFLFLLFLLFSIH